MYYLLKMNAANVIYCKAIVNDCIRSITINVNVIDVLSNLILWLENFIPHFSLIFVRRITFIEFGINYTQI